MTYHHLQILKKLNKIILDVTTNKNVYRVSVKSLQSRLTLCDPMDRSPPGSSVHGISQVRILEWVAISFSRGSSQFRDCTCACIAGGFYITEPPGKPKLISIVINFPFFITVNILTLTRIVMYFCDLNQPQQSGPLFPSLSQRKRAGATGVFPLTTFFLPQIGTGISNGSNFQVMQQT